jgi:small redox-active disulfide protein 2
MKIKVLGPGCVNCQRLYDLTVEALKETGLSAEIEYVKDPEVFGNYIMTTPGLVINEKVVHQGKPTPSKTQIKAILTAAQ